MLKRTVKLVLSIKKAIDRPERPVRSDRGQIAVIQEEVIQVVHVMGQGRSNDNHRAPKENFESKMARFLKDSEDRLSSLKRNTESKRGGRGARRG